MKKQLYGVGLLAALLTVLLLLAAPAQGADFWDCGEKPPAKAVRCGRRHPGPPQYVCLGHVFF